MDDELAQVEAEIAAMEAEHDPSTAEGIAFCQQAARANLQGLNEEVGPILKAVVLEGRTLGELSADESAALVSYLTALANAFSLYVLAPGDYLRSLIADDTPVYTDNLEA